MIHLTEPLEQQRRPEPQRGLLGIFLQHRTRVPQQLRQLPLPSRPLQGAGEQHSDLDLTGFQAPGGPQVLDGLVGGSLRSLAQAEMGCLQVQIRGLACLGGLRHTQLSEVALQATQGLGG